MEEKKVIIAPLNWGLGHATRCIPIIKALLVNGYAPVIASDGNALALLHQEFPQLEVVELPSYNIRYGKHLKTSLIKQTPAIVKTIKREKRVIKQYIASNDNLVGIISDNRFGVRSKKIPSVYITHQLNVLSGWSTFLTSKVHQSIIEKFDECWVPDDKGSYLSGKLSLDHTLKVPVKYCGILSRLEKKPLAIRNDIIIILSGVEPNRSLLEEKLTKIFKDDTRRITLIQGSIEKKQRTFRNGNMKTINYLLSHELEKEINQSKLIICRSGYSSIMDLTALGKKCFFIPTTGQDEQEYLAKYLEEKKIAPFCTENKFTKEELNSVEFFSGFEKTTVGFNTRLLNLFKRK